MNDRISFSMHGTLAMVVHDEATGLEAVRDPARRTVITGREDPVLAGEHAPNAGPRTGRPGRDRARDLQKIVIPPWPRHRGLFR